MTVNTKAQAKMLRQIVYALMVSNQNSSQPGKFARHATPVDPSFNYKPLYSGDTGNEFASNLGLLYSNNTNSHYYLNQSYYNNGIPLATFRPLTKNEQNQLIHTYQYRADHPNYESDIDRNKHIVNNLQARFSSQHGQSNPYMYNDKYVNNILGNAINMDTSNKGENSTNVYQVLHQYLNHHQQQPIARILKPSYVMNTGHGLSWVLLYNHPIELSSDSKRHYQQIHNWKRSQVILANHMNQLTGKLFGKGLVNLKAIKPTSTIHMPYTEDVQFRKSTKTAISVLMNNQRYNYADIQKHTNHLAPLYPKALKQLSKIDKVIPEDSLKDSQYYKPFLHSNDTLHSFWTNVNQAPSRHPTKAPTVLNPAYLSTSYDLYSAPYMKVGGKHRNRYPYGYHQFNGLDYLDYIGFGFHREGNSKNIEIEDGALSMNSAYDTGDNSSVKIRQYPVKGDIYKYREGKIPANKIQTYSQINSYSHKWDDVLESYWIGTKPAHKGETKTLPNGMKIHARHLDDVTQLIILHHGLSVTQDGVTKAHRIRYEWFMKLNAMGKHKTGYSYNDYGAVSKGTFARHNNKVQNKENKQHQSSIYTDLAMRQYDNSYHRYLKYHKNGSKAMARKSAQRWVNNLTDSKVVKDYLIYARAWSPKMVNYYLKRGLVRGYGAYHPVARDKNGTIIYHKNKQGKMVSTYSKDIKDAQVEFIHRRPRNSAEAHWRSVPDTKQTTIAHDLELAKNPKYLPKAGEQDEVPCEIDTVYITPAKYKDKNGQEHIKYKTDKQGHKHIFYTKDMNVNNSGKGIDQHGLKDYGWTFKSGNGDGNLFVFEAPNDAESLYQQVMESGNKKEINMIKNSTALALCGSGTKVDNIVSFMKRNYATGHEYNQIHICTDNDYAGYNVSLQLMSQNPDLKKYMQDSKKRQVYVDVPISPDRTWDDNTLRYGALLSADGKFNKDFNDEEQNHEFGHKIYKHAFHQYNPIQFNKLMGRQTMVSIYELDATQGLKEHKSKPEIQKAITNDLRRFNVMTHVEAKLYSNNKTGVEKIDKENPRIKLMEVLKQGMSHGTLNKKQQDTDGVQHFVSNYFSNNGDGELVNPKLLSQGSDKFYQDRYHETNPWLKNKAFQKELNKPYTLSPSHCAINRAIQQSKHPNAQKLYSTALWHLKQIWVRQAYCVTHTPQFVPKLRKMTHNYHIYYQDNNQRAISGIQTKVDGFIVKKCVDKLQKQYPDDLKNMQLASPSIDKIIQRQQGHHIKFTSADKMNDINGATYASDYMTKKRQNNYTVDQFIDKKPLAQVKNAIRQYNENIQTTKYKRMKNYRKNHKFYRHKRYMKFSHQRSGFYRYHRNNRRNFTTNRVQQYSKPQNNQNNQRTNQFRRKQSGSGITKS